MHLNMWFIYRWRIYVFDNHNIIVFHASIYNCVSASDFAVKSARQNSTLSVLEMIKTVKMNREKEIIL